MRFGIGLSPCELYRDYTGAAKADFAAKLRALERQRLRQRYLAVNHPMAMALRMDGFENVRLLYGGFNEWKARGGMEACARASKKS